MPRRTQSEPGRDNIKKESQVGGSSGRITRYQTAKAKLAHRRVKQSQVSRESSPPKLGEKTTLGTTGAHTKKKPKSKKADSLNSSSKHADGKEKMVKEQEGNEMDVNEQGADHDVEAGFMGWVSERRARAMAKRKGIVVIPANETEDRDKCVKVDKDTEML